MIPLGVRHIGKVFSCCVSLLEKESVQILSILYPLETSILPGKIREPRA